MGISSALEEAGILIGDTVFIGDEILEWGESRRGRRALFAVNGTLEA